MGTKGFEYLEDDEDDFYSEENLSKVEDYESRGDDVKEVNKGDEDTPKKGGGFTLEEDDEVQLEKPSSGEIILEDDEDEDRSSGMDMLSMEEKMKYYSDMVISCLVGKKAVRKHALDTLLSSADPRLFRNENYIIYSVFYNYRARIKLINIDSEFLSLVLVNNRNIVTKAKPYIDIASYGEVDGSYELGYISGVIKHFNRLVNKAELTEEEFNLYFEKYCIAFKAVEAQKVYANSNQILTDSLKIGSRTYSGFEDSFNYVRRELSDIEGLVDMNKGSGFTNMRDVIMNAKGISKKPIKIGDFDKLEVLNKVYGGIYTSNFYEVLAPSKGGKSKFCARACHTAMVKYGTNVTVWAQEGGNDAWSAQMRAIHFDYSYNEGVGLADKKYGVDQDTILQDKFESDELRELELVSSMDLATNTEYGSIDFIDRPFEVETFLEDIDASVKANNSQFIIIDYLQIIGSAKSMSERERISKAYQDLLPYCKKNNVAVLTPAQYKQEVINALASKTDTSDSEMRTSGGGSSEVFRTPDVIFALWASTADLRNNKMSILSIPGRFTKPFPEAPCYIDLGVCKFVSLEG